MGRIPKEGKIRMHGLGSPREVPTSGRLRGGVLDTGKSSGGGVFIEMNKKTSSGGGGGGGGKNQKYL